MLAYELGKDVEEIELWGIDKVAYWLAYFKVTHEMREKQRSKDKPKRGR